MLSILATITEIFGIGVFLPIFQFIRLKGDVNALVSDSSLWEYVINIFSYFGMQPTLVPLLFISFFFFSIRQIFVYLRLVYNTTIIQRLIQAQRNILFSSYIDASTSYHDSVPVGDLVNVIVTEVDNAIVGLMAPLGLLVYTIMLIGYLIVLSMLSWQMTLFSVVALMFASMIPRTWISKSALVGRNLVNANTSMSEFLVGRLHSPRLVRLAGTENAEKEEFQNLTLSQRKNMVSGAILQSKTEVSMEPIIIGLSLIFLYISYAVLQLQVEVIGLYLVISMRLMPIVKSILLQIQSIQRILGSIEILEDRLNSMKDLAELDNGVKSIVRLNKSILFSKVYYCYPQSKDKVLKNITIEIEANKMIAIVGPSGSGKSTLIDLLPRLRTPTNGSIQVDGINIEEYSLKNLRKLIAYAPQNPQIFNGTIRRHILYGKVDATDEEINDAINLSGSREFVNQLPKGIETTLGEDAVRLSGGQKQRIDLARVIIKKAPIMILDEPTSNLDVESGNVFKKILHNIIKETNTTVIIVSHHLPSIVNADKIIVLNQGKVKESGTHSELCEQKGWYAKAWKIQKSGTE
jgi:ABC-type multidrug transport system fused ATPase/permease subunit